MLTFRASWLDKRNCIGIFYEKDGTPHWMLISFYEDCDPSEIIELHSAPNGELFSMTEIDPNCFEWDGKKYKLEQTVVDTGSEC